MWIVIISGASVNQVAKKTGGLSRAVAGLTSDPGDAREYADAFQETFNANAETLRQYANDRLDAGDTVTAIRFGDRQGHQSKRYLVASTDETAKDLEEAQVIDHKRFENLDQSIDQHVAVDWYLSRNAATELETFVEKFADQNKDPSQTYMAKIAVKYGDSVESDLVDRLVSRFDGV